MDTVFARQQMVEQQVRAWDVLDPDVLQVLKDIPREQFVPTGYESLAFADTEMRLSTTPLRVAAVGSMDPASPTTSRRTWWASSRR